MNECYKEEQNLTTCGNPAPLPKCLCSGKHPDPVHLWMAARKKKLTPPPWGWPFQEIFARFMAFLLYFLTSSPSLFYKRNWPPDPIRWFFWDSSLPSSRSAGFPNKVSIPCLNTSSPDLLACCAASRASLDSVTWAFKFLRALLAYPWLNSGTVSVFACPMLFCNYLNTSFAFCSYFIN